MDYIKGNLTILNKIGDYIETGHLFYGASEVSKAEILDIEQFFGQLTEIDVPDTFGSSGITLPYTTKVPGRVLGTYGVLAYPAEYGTLKHIYCVYENQMDLHIDLLSSWELINLVKDNVVYNVYIQARRTKELNVNYKFEFERGE